MHMCVEVEKKLREGQANDALEDLRSQLITSYALQQEKKKVTGQKRTTRQLAAIGRKKRAIEVAAERYRRARGALICLGMSEDDKTFKELKKEDVKAFVVYTADQQLGDSKKESSWIWEDLSFVKNANNEALSEYYEDGTL